MNEVSGLTRIILDRARRSRDARFDGRFFIAVRSTRIYCRPICPSKLSHDRNIHYYATAEEAAEAGYRPCLRCRPEAAPGSAAWRGTSAVVQRALKLIHGGALDKGSVGHLANQLGIGVRHLNRLFHQHLGASPGTVARTRRLQFAKRLLDDTDVPITELALASGYGSIRRFNHAFRATYRRSPTDLRKRRAAGIPSHDAEITLRLAYRPPYDWDYFVSFLAAVAIPGVEVVNAGNYARAIRTPSGYAFLQIQPAPREHALVVRAQGVIPAELPWLLSSVRRMFDLSADPAHVALTFRDDDILRHLVARRPGLRVPGDWDPYECCVRAVFAAKFSMIEQTRSLRNLVERFGKPIAPTMPGIRYLFPEPAVLADGNLEQCGISGKYGETLRELSRCLCDKRLRLDSSVEEVTGTLCEIDGIGRWAAGLVALRGLGEPDALPFGDPRLRRLMSRGKKPLTPLALDARAEFWRPFRGYAVFHAWAVDSTSVFDSRYARAVDVQSSSHTFKTPKRQLREDNSKQ